MDFLTIPFSIFFFGFAVFWELGVLGVLSEADKGASGPVSLFFPLFGVPFVLVGLYLLFGRFIVDARRRADTYYGLTEGRVIIVSDLWGRNVTSLPISSLRDVSLNEKSDGTGTISFGQNQFAARMTREMYGVPFGSGQSCLERIQDADDVFETIMDLQRES